MSQDPESSQASPKESSDEEKDEPVNPESKKALIHAKEENYGPADSEPKRVFFRGKGKGKYDIMRTALIRSWY